MPSGTSAAGSRWCRSASGRPADQIDEHRLVDAVAAAASRRARLQCDRRRFLRRFARRMGSVPRRRRARRADRLSGQAARRIADRPGRARASVGKQLRLAASRARLFLLQGPGRLPVRAAAPSGGAAGDGGWSRIAIRARQRRARRCSARSASAMPASGSPSTSSAPCSPVAVEDERTRGDDQRRRRPHHPRRQVCCASCGSTSCRRSSTS